MDLLAQLVAPAMCHLTSPSFSALITTNIAFLRVGIQPLYQERGFPFVGNTMIFKLLNCVLRILDRQGTGWAPGVLPVFFP